MSRADSPHRYFHTTFVVLAAASLLWIWMLPGESVTRIVAARAIAVVATLFLVRRLLAVSGPARIAWTLVWAYQALTLLADLVYSDLQVLDTHPVFPDPSDVLYLLTYVLAFAAVLTLGRLLHPEMDPRLRVELRALAGTMIAVVALVLIGPWLLEDRAERLQPLVDLAYPLLDLLVLLLLLAVLHGRLAGNASMRLLVAAFTGFLVLDTAYYLLAIMGDATDYGLLEVAWTAALLLITFAAYAPGAEAAPSGASLQGAGVDG